MLTRIHMLTRVLACSVITLAAANPTLAQSGLEGTTVILKIDMPASSDGVDVNPMGGGVDFRSLNDRLHRYGVGVHNGESIMITKVVYKKNHIEVQLGGGGYGTFADSMAQAASTPYVPYEGKSRREKDLEEESKYAYTHRERRDAREDLEEERRERNRANAQAAATNAQTRAITQAAVDAKRAGAGSRFNIRYDNGVPPNAGTAQGIMEALDRYVDFGDDPRPSSSSSARPRDTGPPSSDGSAANQLSALRKGMTVPQVEQVLGPADNVRKETEGSLDVVVRDYAADDGQRVTTKFAGGVLIDYSIASRR